MRPIKQELCEIIQNTIWYDSVYLTCCKKLTDSSRSVLVSKIQILYNLTLSVWIQNASICDILVRSVIINIGIITRCNYAPQIRFIPKHSTRLKLPLITVIFIIPDVLLNAVKQSQYIVVVYRFVETGCETGYSAVQRQNSRSVSCHGVTLTVFHFIFVTLVYSRWQWKRAFLDRVN